MSLREFRLQWSERAAVVSLGPMLLIPRDSAQLFWQVLQEEAVEVFGVLCLTTKHQVLGYHEVSRGTLDCVVVHPRDVFKAALLANAAAVIVGHNHPSGDPTPSPEDYAMTERLLQASQILGVPVLDHVIVGLEDRYYSFRESHGIERRLARP